MPQSRKRRPRPGPSSTKRRPRLSDAEIMRSVPLVQAVDEAERRGDAEEALRLMLTHAEGLSFWRPRRCTCVLQMAWLAPVLPGWARSRWIVAQAAQHLGERNDPVARSRFHRALGTAIELRGGPDELPGRDLVDRQCRVLDHDWVFRELLLYDLGALQHFVRRVATPDLLAGADRIAEWPDTPMGGYRYVGCDPGTATWRDLAADSVVVTANIGSAATLRPGDCALGRLVPIEGGAMFEAPPLPVPEAVALAVGAEPRRLGGGAPGGSSRPDGRRGPSVQRAAERRAGRGARAGRRAGAHPGGLDPWCRLFAALVEPRYVQELARRQASLDRSQRRGAGRPGRGARGARRGLVPPAGGGAGRGCVMPATRRSQTERALRGSVRMTSRQYHRVARPHAARDDHVGVDPEERVAVIVHAAPGQRLQRRRSPARRCRVEVDDGAPGDRRVDPQHGGADPDLPPRPRLLRVRLVAGVEDHRGTEPRRPRPPARGARRARRRRAARRS